MKPTVLYSHEIGHNPWKVALILTELSLPYETRFIDFTAVKKEPYTLVNTTGRLAAIQDPNNGITLWESGAIIEYVADTTRTTRSASTPARKST